ncbi:hypothetical protein ACWDRR_22100 [Kitasatospora sp. NPDC003701]
MTTDEARGGTGKGRSLKAVVQPPMNLAPAPPWDEMSLQERQARRLLEGAEWEPIVPWPGERTLAWPRRCRCCGFVVDRSPTPLEVTACVHPTPEDEAAVLAVVEEAGWEPAERWPGSPTIKWALQCKGCGVLKKTFGKRGGTGGVKPCTRSHDGILVEIPAAGPVPAAEWVLPDPMPQEDQAAELSPSLLQRVIEGRLRQRRPDLRMSAPDAYTVAVSYDPYPLPRDHRARDRGHDLLRRILDDLVDPAKPSQECFHVDYYEDPGGRIDELQVRRLTPREMAVLKATTEDPGHPSPPQ